ncbi:PREDICTED: uncharacterized protein LOC105462767 isoform X2 [Wasmannia auropunctata]|nr:PREDICTED: uncharacterized protein LOC105462767 isoform X2 [Wasmannia auropunctata]
MECHYLREFMKQNKYLVTNEQLFLYLERLIGPRKSEKSILTVQEICHEIAKGKLHGIKELSKRYKEWDLSTLDFINQRIKLLSHFDLYTVLEYLHYRFGCLNTKTEKYEVYASILKILNQLNVGTMHTFLLKYVMRHFDDNRLEYLYDEQYFDEFIHNSCISSLRELTPTLSSINDYRILLTFILLNPKEVLSKLVIYEMSTFPNTVLFKNSTHFLRMYYNLHKDCNIQTVLTSILRNIILFQQGVIRENTRFIRFMDNVLHHQMMNANDVINEIYIDYLINCSQGMNLERRNVYTDVILSHIQSILRRQLYTCNIKSALLVTILVKMTSLLRGCNTISKYILYQRVEVINDIISNLQLNVLTEKQNNDLYAVDTCVQPLDIRKLHPGKRTLEIIQEYETRCLSLNERLRTNPRCHPKLRSYMQSFDLNREAFIRHMILHSFAGEYKMYMMDLTFRFWYHLGWTNQRMAYENVMRITAEAMLIVLVYAETFYKDTFILLLYSIVNYCESVTRKMTCDKHKTIRCILLRTLSSMESIVSKTYYARMYNHLLKRIQNLEPRLYQDLNRNTYFKQIREMINEYVDEYDFQTTPLVNTE